jgi:hypothetical protein
MRRFLGKSTRIETLALIISIVFVFGSTSVLARGGGHGGGHGHTGGHRGHSGGQSSVFSHTASGSFIRPAWHSWRHHHHHLLIIPVRFPAFGYPVYGYTCYGPFWPYFSYDPCLSYYRGWTTPSTDLISPLGNKLARAYALPAQLDVPEETKEAEQIESSGGSSEFVRQGEAALKARDYRSAVRAWRHAVVDDPKNGTTIMMLAQALFAAGEYDEAAAAAQQAMMLLPEEKWREAVSKFRGFYTNTQDYTDQLTKLEKAVEGYPNDPSLRFELGFQYANSNHPDLALRELDKLLEMAPQDQIGRKLRDLVNKEREAEQVPAN